MNDTNLFFNSFLFIFFYEEEAFVNYLIHRWCYPPKWSKLNSFCFVEQGEYCLRLIAKYKAMGDVNEGELRCLVEVVFDVLNLKSNPQKPAILTEVLLLATKFKEVATFDLCITRYQKLEITNQDESWILTKRYCKLSISIFPHKFKAHGRHKSSLKKWNIKVRSKLEQKFDVTRTEMIEQNIFEELQIQSQIRAVVKCSFASHTYSIISMYCSFASRNIFETLESWKRILHLHAHEKDFLFLWVTVIHIPVSLVMYQTFGFVIALERNHWGTLTCLHMVANFIIKWWYLRVKKFKALVLVGNF